VPYFGYIATQSKTEREAKENMTDLINDYLSDPDTVKTSFEDLMSFSLTNIPLEVPEGVLRRKAWANVAAKGN
jgi:hypothetical protein